MTVAALPLFDFDNSFVRDLDGLYRPWQATVAPLPRLLMLNHQLAIELGLDPDALQSEAGVAMLVGNLVPEGAAPVAQAYAGHQFGGFSPQLGDGRALLVGEVIDTAGRRRDLHLKGSGRTPFARGGDGRAAVGPMLREFVIGEAMHALGIPTTRALAVVATGQHIARDTMLPGAVLARVASSHLRVGSFQFAANSGDPDLVRRLADHAIARHHPHAIDTPAPYLTFFEAVVDDQAALIARWMLVGFVHGVMNTDNMTISGETIDYGPCAFIDAYDPATVFSSVDAGGRYAFGNQATVGQWNLARLAETLLPLFDGDTQVAVELATQVLVTFADRFRTYWRSGMRAKLGLGGSQLDDGAVIDDLMVLLQAQAVDFTRFFRALSSPVTGDVQPARSMFGDPQTFDDWSSRWLAQVAERPAAAAAIAAQMDRVNPIYIPRNHIVEQALTAAVDGDMAPFEQLLAVLARPFDQRDGLEQYELPAPDDFGRYRTFCGT